ncbi:MAG: hypothetical protein ACRD3Q_15855 [Terriglobales bacterium]
MKASDRRRPIASETVEGWTLEHAPSALADPPISAEEAHAADHATCRWHHGHITHTRVTGDAWGKVYFCPIGRQYWRLSQELNDFLRPLQFR